MSESEPSGQMSWFRSREAPVSRAEQYPLEATGARRYAANALSKLSPTAIACVDGRVW